MNDQNEIGKNQSNSAQAQTDNKPAKKITLAAVVYVILNLLYFLLFLASLPVVLVSPMIFDGGDSAQARIGFYLIVAFPLIVIGILAFARVFYRKRRLKAAFLVLLLPPFLYLVFLLLQAFYWSLSG